MANSFIKAEKVIRTILGMLEREIVLPGLVWRDAAGDFSGAKNDTVSIRVPAYANARTRQLRGGTPITVDELTESKVDVTLDTDVYKAVGISDEELTLDIESFGEQVLNPVVTSVARGVEDLVVAEMTGATYANTVDADPDDPYDGIVDARKALLDARVPMSGLVLAVGSSFEAAVLKSDRFARVDASGSDSALRDATIGRVAGFQTVTVPALPPESAFAFHRTAYVLGMRAPVVPEGASWGASQSFAGLAMRALRDYDFLNVRDRLLADVFAGTAITEDYGELDSDGVFTPSDEVDLDNDTPIFVRAVELTLNG